MVRGEGTDTPFQICLTALCPRVALCHHCSFSVVFDWQQMVVCTRQASQTIACYQIIRCVCSVGDANREGDAASAEGAVSWQRSSMVERVTSAFETSVS